MSAKDSSSSKKRKSLSHDHSSSTKKKRKAELEPPTEHDVIDDEQPALTNTKLTSNEGDEEAQVQTAEDKNQRFIVFIGNLPYTATQSSLATHFAKIKPTAIRHRTEKGTDKSKGFAFLEFNAYDRMKTCLQLYHHSSFDDGKSAARRINVELTAGGGGKSKWRKDKVRAKNVKLDGQRKNRALEAAKTKNRADGKGKSDGSGRRRKQYDVAPTKVEGARQAPMMDAESQEGIHPSRRAQLAR